MKSARRLLIVLMGVVALLGGAFAVDGVGGYGRVAPVLIAFLVFVACAVVVAVLEVKIAEAAQSAGPSGGCDVGRDVGVGPWTDMAMAQGILRQTARDGLGRGGKFGGPRLGVDTRLIAMGCEWVVHGMDRPEAGRWLSIKCELVREVPAVAEQSTGVPVAGCEGDLAEQWARRIIDFDPEFEALVWLSPHDDPKMGRLFSRFDVPRSGIRAI